jgi:hypothetical protein
MVPSIPQLKNKCSSVSTLWQLGDSQQKPKLGPCWQTTVQQPKRCILHTGEQVSAASDEKLEVGRGVFCWHISKELDHSVRLACFWDLVGHFAKLLDWDVGEGTKPSWYHTRHHTPAPRVDQASGTGDWTNRHPAAIDKQLLSSPVTVGGPWAGLATSRHSRQSHPTHPEQVRGSCRILTRFDCAACHLLGRTKSWRHGPAIVGTVGGTGLSYRNAGYLVGRTGRRSWV